MLLYNNIFLVEDDTDDQMLFVEAIKVLDNNIKYTIAYDGRDALNKLRIIKHLPDLIFLDINMPRMDGFEFLKLVKADPVFNQIPVIILSTSNNIAEQVIKCGASGYIVKPTSTKQLQLTIEHIFNLMQKELI